MTVNVAHEILKRAAEAGMTIAVVSEGIVDYRGTSYVKAWEACNAVEESTVILRQSDGSNVGRMLVIPGLLPEETVADYGPTGGWIDAQWEQIFTQNEKAA